MGNVPVKKSDEEWRELLSADAYHVLIERGTERCVLRVAPSAVSYSRDASPRWRGTQRVLVAAGA